MMSINQTASRTELPWWFWPCWTVALHVILILFWTLACGFVRTDSVQADQTSNALKIHSVQVGIEGFYKNGLWTPILIQWENQQKDTPQVEVSVPTFHTPLSTLHSQQTDSPKFDVSVQSTDSDGTPIVYKNILTSCQVPTPTEENPSKRILTRFYARLGRKTGTISVRITVDGIGTVEEQFSPSGRGDRPNSRSGPSEQKGAQKETTRFFEPVPNERPIFLIVGNENIGLQGAVAELSLREDRRPLLVKVESFASLPELSIGLEAIDTIVLTTTDPKMFDGLTAKSPQITAIDEWIRSGGRLFFCAGKDAGPLLETEESVLRPFLPGKYNRMTDLRQGTRLETYVASKWQISMNGTEEAPFMKMPLFSEPRGIVMLKEIDLPLLLRCAHGFGTIVYFGGDLSAKPLLLWRDRVRLVRKILQWDAEKPVAGRGNVALIQLGYNDISGQIRSALDRFDDVRIVPFSILLIILAVYWLVVGFFDWVVVHKVFKRPILTWITFPLWILLFSVLAYFLMATGRPNRVMLNELDLVDVDAETGMVRLSCWGSLYSPNDARYTLQSTPAVLGSRDQMNPNEVKQISSILSWNGLPGTGLGGMAPKTVSPTVWQAGSEQNALSSGKPLSKIEGVPVQVRSTKSFFGQSLFRLNEQRVQALSVSELTDEEGIPVGRIEFGPDMPILDHCIMVYGRWVQDLGTVQPGQTVVLGKKTVRREMRDLLLPQRTHEILDDRLRRQVSYNTAYNTESTDLHYIARVFSLYGVLGEFEAVGLFNSYLRLLDMSDLFTVDRAMLMGVMRDPTMSSLGTRIDTGEAPGAVSGRHLALFRQSVPIRLGVLSPRLQLDRGELKKDDLADPDKTLRGQGEYSLPE